MEYEDIISDDGILNKDVRGKQTGKRGILFEEGDVLYGKLRPYLHNWLKPSFNGVAVGDFWVLQPHENIDVGFLYTLIKSPMFDSVANLSSGSKMPRADWNLVSSSAFSVPSTKEEQHKIGKLFGTLDDSISLHQRSWTTDPCSNKPGQRSHDQIDVFVLELLDDVEVGSLGCVHG